jgi:hypothetical protein
MASELKDARRDAGVRQRVYYLPRRADNFAPIQHRRLGCQFVASSV